jgi:hypothetical protein
VQLVYEQSQIGNAWKLDLSHVSIHLGCRCWKHEKDYQIWHRVVVCSAVGIMKSDLQRYAPIPDVLAQSARDVAGRHRRDARTRVG